jgi:membrane-associated protease RseP (regulator of RpoE activity)
MKGHPESMDSPFPAWRPSRRVVILISALGLMLALRDPLMALEISGTVVLGVGLLTLIVIVHELAHALTARVLGVKVHEFGIFIPPRLATLGHVGGVAITLNWIPLGGFTRLAGEKKAEGPDDFKAASLPRQLAIIGAGPASNLILAYVLFLALTLTSTTHPASEGFNRAGDLMLTTISSVLGAFISLPGALLADPTNVPVVGLPGIVAFSGQAADLGLRGIVGFVAIISTSVGLLNLLPLPPLDGGGMLVAVIERFAGLRSARAIAALATVGLVFIIALGILANGADIVRIVSGQNVFGP